MNIPEKFTDAKRARGLSDKQTALDQAAFRVWVTGSKKRLELWADNGLGIICIACEQARSCNFCVISWAYEWKHCTSNPDGFLSEIGQLLRADATAAEIKACGKKHAQVLRDWAKGQ